MSIRIFHDFKSITNKLIYQMNANFYFNLTACQYMEVDYLL